VIVNGTTFQARELRPGSTATFDDLLDLLTSLVRGGELAVLAADPRLYGVEAHWSVRALFQGLGDRMFRWGGRTLVNTIGECSVIQLANLGAAWDGDLPSPQLLGSNQAIRYVCSYAVDPAVEAKTVESLSLRTDFSAFAHLWASSGASQKPPYDEGFRKLDAAGIGQTMGDLHELPFMWIDAHRSQFAWETGRQDWERMIAFDTDEHSWPLYRKPSAAQCATMLLPLLSWFDASEFEGFFGAYVNRRGDGGLHVLHLIQFGDRTGWKLAFDAGDYNLAAQRANAQISEDEESGSEPMVSLRSLLGVSYSRLGRHRDARRVYELALRSVDPDGLDVPNLMFNLGQCHYRAGEIAQAAEAFQDVIQRERQRQSMRGLLEAAITMLGRCAQ
jgi:hypothetical protein